ncbi:MAG: precorrin-8X methylmutase [Nitrospirota bacterium]
MEGIILVGHGSPKKDANRMELVGRLLHSRLHPGCASSGCVRVAYLQYDNPGLMEAIESAARDGMRRLVIHPYFLSSGVHVTRDIPGIIEEARALYPDLSFLYTDPLGVAEELVHVVMGRIEAAKGLPPGDIEPRSFQAIEREESLEALAPEVRPIVRRVIHATADFQFLSAMAFHPDAVRAGLSAIREGKNVLADVEMVRAGLDEKSLSRRGGRVLCRIREASRRDGQTRAEAAVEEALDESVGIVAVGNAPTALLRIIHLIRSGRARPDLVVGVPVGFVQAVEAKALLAAQDFPFITALGRKGGSPVAAAIVNALLRMVEGGDGKAD